MRIFRTFVVTRLGCAVLQFLVVHSMALVWDGDSRANAAEINEAAKIVADSKPRERNQPPKPIYQDYFPKAEISDLQEKSDKRTQGFDDEDRSFSEDVKNRNLKEMEDFATAIPEYVDVPNAVRALLTSASLSVRLQRTDQGWRPVRIAGEPYLRAIFLESWTYFSKQTDFRRALEKIDYPAVRFQVNLTVVSSLAFDQKPRPRIQGNFVALELVRKRATAKEWPLLASWIAAATGPVFAVDFLALANYIYDTYKNWNREDPVLLRLRQSPAYRAPLKEDYEVGRQPSRHRVSRQLYDG